MVSFKRKEGAYAIDYVTQDLTVTANAEKTIPLEWICNNGTDLTEDFVEYALPLIQGDPNCRTENGLPSYSKLKMVKFKL